MSYDDDLFLLLLLFNCFILYQHLLFSLSLSLFSAMSRLGIHF